jgi:hypothetical protein
VIEYGPCVWEGCLFKADDVILGVHLIYEGRSFTKERVPLCGEHLQQFGRSKRMTLRPEFLLAYEPR